jgi:hypothetical protein
MMLPFYRMPVFYLAALILACALWMIQWGRSAASRPVAGVEAVVASTTSRTMEPPAQPERPGAGQAPPAEADAIMRTEAGFRRKVVVKDLDVVCRSEPQGGREVGPPLDYFAIRYVYREWPEGAPTRVEIGPRGGPAQGWVRSAAVLEWDTRLMARPTPRSGRPPLVIYREEDCLLDRLAQRACRRHAGRCPTEGEEGQAGGMAGDAAGSPALGMPILASREIPLPDGSTRTIFEVASLVRDLAPIPVPVAPPPDLLPALRRIEIAFVIDTTASMQATIDAARELASRLAADASQHYRDVTLRLALVEYRDASPHFGFKTRTVTDFTTPNQFRAALGTIDAAIRGDGSIDEAVLDGVAEALPPSPGEPPGARHLAWSSGGSGDLATKLLVLLGDAPDHARDLQRARDLAERARRSGIMVAALAVERPGQLSRDERRRYRQQWQALAQGSFRPLDKASGFARRVDAAWLSLDQADQLVPSLQALIDDRIEHARNLAALAAAEAEGRLAAYVNSQGLTLDRVAPVLVDLHRGEASGPPRPDPRRSGRKAPSVRRGWIAEQLNGAALVTIEVLMSRAELDVLIDELTQWQQAAQGSARDLADLLQIGNAAAAGETGFLAADRSSQTFADHLRRRQGLPPPRADSLLRRTQTDLLQADDSYRSALDARLGASLASLIRRRNDQDWSDPRRTVDGMALVPYALIDF